MSKRKTIAELNRRAAALKGWGRRHSRAGNEEAAREALAGEARALATVARRRMSSLRYQMKSADAAGLTEAAAQRRTAIGRRIREQRDHILTWERTGEEAAGRPLPPVIGPIHAGTHAETRYVGSARALLGLMEARPTVDVLQVVPFGHPTSAEGRLPPGTRTTLDELGLEGEERQRALDALRLVDASGGGAQVTLEVGKSDEKTRDRAKELRTRSAKKEAARKKRRKARDKARRTAAKKSPKPRKRKTRKKK